MSAKYNSGDWRMPAWLAAPLLAWRRLVHWLNGEFVNLEWLKAVISAKSLRLSVCPLAAGRLTAIDALSVLPPQLTGLAFPRPGDAWVRLLAPSRLGGPVATAGVRIGRAAARGV